MENDEKKLYKALGPGFDYRAEALDAVLALEHTEIPTLDDGAEEVRALLWYTRECDSGEWKDIVYARNQLINYLSQLDNALMAYAKYRIDYHEAFGDIPAATKASAWKAALIRLQSTTVKNPYERED